MLYERYYYSVLSAREKSVYKTIYKCIENHEKKVSLLLADCFDVNTADIVHYILLDNPHIYYVDHHKYSWVDYVHIRKITFRYLYTKEQVEELNVKINNALRGMLGRVSGKTDYEKEKSVHDLIVKNVVYDKKAIANMDKYVYVANSVLGVLFYKTAICEGISKIFKMLLNLLDIKCLVVNGDADGSHAWNIVKINGESYHVDVTWDLPDDKRAVCYDYFNLSDKEISVNHSFGNDLPVCKYDNYNYFRYSGLLAESESAIKKIVRRSLSENKNFVYIKFGDNISYERGKRKVFDMIFAGFTYYERPKLKTLLCLLND